MQKSEFHPRISLEEWAARYPYRFFELNDDLEGSPVRSIVDLCRVEAVRKLLGFHAFAAEGVNVDLILWSTEKTRYPFLTKIGGVPHRESRLRWPLDADGNPYTFVAQFCFVDSKTIVPFSVKRDILLVFFRDPRSYVCEDTDIYLEWSDVKLERPISQLECPELVFPVPEFSGVLCSYQEFEWKTHLIENAGFDAPYYFASTEASKIGKDAFFIQDDPRVNNEGLQLLCTLDSFYPRELWPFINIPTSDELAIPPKDTASRVRQYEVLWHPHEILFSGSCLYFLVDESGKPTWHHGIA